MDETIINFDDTEVEEYIIHQRKPYFNKQYRY